MRLSYLNCHDSRIVVIPNCGEGITHLSVLTADVDDMHWGWGHPVRHPARISAIQINMIIGGKILGELSSPADIALLGSKYMLITDG